MSQDQIRLKARIQFLSTEDGGRTTPLLGGSSYRPNHNFFGPDDRDMCMGFIELADREQVKPGETIEKEVTLWIYPDVETELYVGRKWRIQEGAKLVAIGMILELLD